MNLLRICLCAILMCPLLQTGLPAITHAYTQEFDLVLKDWRQGLKLSLRHPIFALESVRGGDAFGQVILFQGQSFGEAGQVYVDFYTLEGDLIAMPKGSLVKAQVDAEKRAFTVGGIIPAQLRGREGVVQVIFAGKGRASFLLKVYF